MYDDHEKQGIRHLQRDCPLYMDDWRMNFCEERALELPKNRSVRFSSLQNAGDSTTKTGRIRKSKELRRVPTTFHILSKITF